MVFLSLNETLNFSKQLPPRSFLPLRSWGAPLLPSWILPRFSLPVILLPGGQLPGHPVPETYRLRTHSHSQSHMVKRGAFCWSHTSLTSFPSTILLSTSFIKLSSSFPTPSSSSSLLHFAPAGEKYYPGINAFISNLPCMFTIPRIWAVPLLGRATTAESCTPPGLPP